MTAANSVTATTPSTPAIDAHQLYLPVTLASDDLAGAAAPAPDPDTPPDDDPDAAPEPATPPADKPAPPQPIPSNNVDAYQIWRLEAEAGAEVVKHFDQPVLLQVSVKALVAAGVDPLRLGLWTREQGEGRWEPVDAHYDAEQERFAAWLPHFSDFTLGEALTQNGALLPSVRAFSVDRFTGAATLHLPIEAPAGLGGLAPDLGLSYSTVVMDEMYRNEGPDSYKVQASGVGLGWNLSGISYIARAGGSMDNGNPYYNRSYVLVLNGQHVRIQWEQDAWRTDPALFAKIDRTLNVSGGGKDYPQWVVTTADGTRYTFGDASVSDTTFSSTAATATFVQRQDGGAYERTAKEWYLTQVQDPLGNQMEFKCLSEKGDEEGCVPSHRNDLKWYVRATYPTEILWNKHTSGVGPHLRVLFSYDSAARVDDKVEGWGSNDCKQTKYGQYNRLTTVTAQVKDTGGVWRTLRSYALGSSYSAGVTVTGKCDANINNNCKRLLLNTVQLKGKNGGVLHTYSFDYANASPNSIRLHGARNGLGGHILYGYGVYHPKCNHAIRGGISKDNRVAVTQMQTSDDFGNVTTVAYTYGPSDATNSRAMVALSGEFLGFHTVEATTYVLNSTTTVAQWEEFKTWQGAESNLDPRRGRTQRSELRNAAGGTVHARTSYNWNAYRRNYFHLSNCGTADDGWCSSSTTSNTHTENNELRYHTLWVRLDHVSEWASESGRLTRSFYQTGSQNGLQFGNVTRLEEASHSEAFLDLTTWESRVTNNSVTLLRRTDTEYYPNTSANIGNRPARVRVYTGANVCMSEVRSVYDDVSTHFQSVPTQGVLKKTEMALSGCSSTQSITIDNTAWAITRRATDVYGNVITVNRVGGAGNGPLNDITSTVYDSTYKLFPVEQYKNNLPAGLPEYKERATYYGVNGLALSDSKAFWGAIQEHCGVNDICTRQSYDEFGRRARRWERVARGSAWGSDAAAAVLWGYSLVTGNQQRINVTEWRAPRC